jgi:hypothetical protein
MKRTSLKKILGFVAVAGLMFVAAPQYAKATSLLNPLSAATAPSSADGALIEVRGGHGHGHGGRGGRRGGRFYGRGFGGGYYGPGPYCRWVQGVYGPRRVCRPYWW